MPWPEDLRRWSEATGPSFMQFGEKTAVHVERTIEDAETGDVRSVRTPLLDAEDMPAIVAIFSKQTTLCSRTGAPGEQYGVTDFADELLCRACWRATPEDERSRLFEHPTG